MAYSQNDILCNNQKTSVTHNIDEFQYHKEKEVSEDKACNTNSFNCACRKLIDAIKLYFKRHQGNNEYRIQ